MFKPGIIQNIAEQFKGAVPTDLLSDVIKSVLTKMELVSREEFDIQAKVLAKTRAKIEVLEAKVLDMERERKH